MPTLRLSDPFFNDSPESVIRRFFASTRPDTDAVALPMPVDVTEHDGQYELFADLPGLHKEDIRVRIDGNTVHIEALQNPPKEQLPKGEKLLCNERYKGRLSRSLSLADDIDDSHVTARYTDGVLHLQLPKQPASTNHRIAIQ